MNPLASGNLHLEHEREYGVRDLQDCHESDRRVHFLLEYAICEKAGRDYSKYLACVVQGWIIKLIVVVVVQDALLAEQGKFMHFFEDQRYNEEVQATEIKIRLEVTYSLYLKMS